LLFSASPRFRFVLQGAIPCLRGLVLCSQAAGTPGFKLTGGAVIVTGASILLHLKVPLMSLPLLSLPTTFIWRMVGLASVVTQRSTVPLSVVEPPPELRALRSLALPVI